MANVNQLPHKLSSLTAMHTIQWWSKTQKQNTMCCNVSFMLSAIMHRLLEGTQVIH